MSRTDDELHALADVLTRLPEEEPLQRAVHARQLFDAAKAALSNARREAIFQATRDEPYESVADALGVSYVAINKAVTLHQHDSAEHSPEQKDVDTITVAVHNAAQREYQHESFTGRWLVWRATSEQWRVRIGCTVRERVVVYVHPAADWATLSELHDFDTLDEAQAALRDDPRISSDVWEVARDLDETDPTVLSASSPLRHAGLCMPGLAKHALWRDI